MRDYSPRRRTALVLCGSGTAGAYHAGALRALDESGVKIDLVVGSGAGTVAAAYAAVAAGPRLYGANGFWPGVGWDAFFRLRTALRVATLLLAVSFGVFLLPLALALLLGLLFPLLLIADMVAPAWTAGVMSALWALPAVLRAPYLAALSVPVFVLSALGVAALVFYGVRDRRRLAERFESPLDAAPLRERLAAGLWEIARGSAVANRPPTTADLGARYVGMLSENLGQPGFRELILRVADLELGSSLALGVLREPHRAAVASRAISGLVELDVPGYEPLFFEAVLSGLSPPPAPLCRVTFPKGGPFAGQTHRLADATLAGGSGLAEALLAGAEQVIVVAASAETVGPSPRRRGPWAAADAVVATIERQALEQDLASAERMNRMIETVGHRMDDGSRGWQDPASGRVYRELALYVIRPERRPFGPLELDGARDATTDVQETADDLVEQGYHDACRLFVEPVVGASPAPRPPAAETEHQQTVGL